jgi:hypothetical protein
MPLAIEIVHYRNVYGAYFNHAYVGDVSEVSEVHAASIVRIQSIIHFTCFSTWCIFISI